MTSLRSLTVVAAFTIGACSSAPDMVSLACRPMANAEQLASRASPYDSVMVTVGGQAASICYGRPSVKGRTIFGDVVAYDTLWRTGANEPTIIHLPFRADIAGVVVDPGSYSLYTVPGREQFTLIVNAATSQWGIESGYVSAVRRQERGRASVPVEPIEMVEQLVIRTEPADDSTTHILLEWERTRIRIPIRLAPAT